MTEKSLMHRLMLSFSAAGARVFRNHVGQAFQGRSLRVVRPGTVQVQPGDVLVYQARTVRAGLCTGSSDLIGWRPIDITPDMVGRRIARFVACEVKSGGGRIEPEQQRFADAVREAGGIVIIAFDERQALDELTNS